MESRTFAVQTGDKVVGKYVKPRKRMSVKEFQNWLDGIDTNNGGVVLKAAIEEAFESLGMKFTSWMAKQAMAAVDLNNNGVIGNDLELKEIVEYAQRHWGLTIYQDEE